MDLTDPKIRDLGKVLHLDQRRFAADLNSTATKTRVQDSINLCRRLRLTQAPTFIAVDAQGARTITFGDLRSLDSSR
jgi:predicted DsbA family dithiol-disulfide isomerase